MATRSRIGVELTDGSILSVYCHWDGYMEFNGRKLKEYYNNRKIAGELIDGGNISALHTNVGWDQETRLYTGPLYYTERGEKIEDNEPRLDSNLKEYLNNDPEEYAYVFTLSEEWKCYQTDGNPYGATEVLITG